MASVTLNKIAKVYPNGFKAVHEIDFKINDGEFVVLVGPSGCAKSTLLRMVAGLETITSGELRIGDKVVNRTLPKDRGAAMVFQNRKINEEVGIEDIFDIFKIGQGFAGKIDRTKCFTDSIVSENFSASFFHRFFDAGPFQAEHWCRTV